jgi:hypothetical protein
MKVAIIDADLIGRKKHRFPNLACLKLSGYYKELGSDVELKLDYDNLDSYDKVFISKVFTDTPVGNPDNFLNNILSMDALNFVEEAYKNVDLEILIKPNVEYGGTGFYYDKAPKLDCQIEHHTPDYHLYDEWIQTLIDEKIKSLDDKDIIQEEIKKINNEVKYYTDYSIGFMTRGCFRQCSFCVNRNYKKVEIHSALEEFHDPTRKKICLLDDNFMGNPEWKRMLTELQETKKSFQFKQGLDERILTEEKCKMLFNSKYDGAYIFAFDNIEDKELIEKKLQLIRKHTNTIPMFYVFCGFDREDKWDLDFWKQDIADVFNRIEILMKYHCLPYIMRFNKYEESPYRGMYINFARWCNQPSFFKKKSYREFCIANGLNSACHKYMEQFENDCPEIALQFYDIRY